MDIEHEQYTYVSHLENKQFIDIVFNKKTNELLYSENKNGSVNLFDIDTHKNNKTFYPHKQSNHNNLFWLKCSASETPVARHCAISDDGEFFIGGGLEKLVSIWSIKNNPISCELSILHEGNKSYTKRDKDIAFVSFLPNSNSCIVAGYQGNQQALNTVVIYNTKTKNQTTITDRFPLLTALDFDPYKEEKGALTSRSAIHDIDFQAEKITRTIKTAATRILYSKKNNNCYFTSNPKEKRIYFWDTRGNNYQKCIDLSDEFEHGIVDMALDDLGNNLVVTSDKSTAIICPESNREKQIINNNQSFFSCFETECRHLQNNINKVAINKNGTVIALKSDKKLTIWQNNNNNNNN